LARKNLVQALDASLERLGTDYIDVYWVHVWDVFTPVEEVVRALDDAVRAGKVLYAGISDAPAWIVAQAVTLADERGWTRFAGLQVLYSLLERAPEREHPQDTRIATAPGYSELMLTQRKLAIADAVNRIAAARGATSPQVAIAWLRSRQQHAPVIPIVGARRPEQLRDTLGALEIDLTADERADLEAASAIEPGFPNDFGGRAMAYGDTYDRVASHRHVIWPDLAATARRQS
jgi:aryl-alcohol dehydrogenase-like predicted oxidoreductase